MEFEDITVTDVQVTPGPRPDSFEFQFTLSRVPERFWPERFFAAYGTQQGLRLVDLTDNILKITLSEDEVDAFVVVVLQTVRQANEAYRAELASRAEAQQQRLDAEQQRRDKAEALRRKALQTLGL
ncbi:MAG: hypothetical protein AVDCRST_MAG88-3474 [uncultured Thermomicrobiales bacterium]|uniref:Uncharacterized protein n=1 Tax=uncultured Thermomicrobiales bacterium TaxID=1645740 RepID=A0A6J4VKP2_9BACT|nr:MAG: hypothetical protein AVDCRST_MAG88-3474 [uncultured Thermomicrobiales bacterium]